MAGVFTTSSRPNPNLPGVADVEPRDVWENRNKIVIIDVRRPDEFTGELGHISSAQLMVLDTLPQRIEELPRDKTVVFVCRSGGRSGQATAYAMEQGFTQVYNLKGGMLLWNELGLEVAEKNTGN